MIEKAVEGIDTVFHLGPLIAIPYTYQHPIDVIQANVLGTLNILEAYRRNKVGWVVSMSASEVYGTAKYVPIDENYP